MSILELQLPGGVVIAGKLERLAQLRPLDGRLQLQLNDIARAGDPIPQRVSNILEVAVQSIGPHRVERETVAQLCMADRQYLMLQLARILEGDVLWLQCQCQACTRPFDLQLDRAQVPVKPAGEGYPFCNVTINGHELRMHVPTGAMQEAIAEMPENKALFVLLQNCIESVDGVVPDETFIQSLDERAIALIEDSLDEVTADIGTELLIQCPECEMEQRVTFNPYHLNHFNFHELYQEVHTLAYHYHWSEEAILALPQERRHLYLNLIQSARGLHG